MFTSMLVELDYSPSYAMQFDKLETYSVEAVRACASRRPNSTPQIHSLMNNLQLLVDCGNQRQLTQRQYPQYPYHLIAFLPISV